MDIYEGMYIFNPEHDLCLANGDKNFVPPASALKFGKDCGDIVGKILSDGHLSAWGWDAYTRNRLIREGIPPELLPDEETVSTIRELSHRRYARLVRAMLPESNFLLPSRTEELSCIGEVTEFLGRYGSAVLKAPWSGSGKGLRWISSGKLEANDSGWCSNIIEKQGSVMAEPKEDVAADFAVLYEIRNGTVHNCGYSLFHTVNGAYRSNLLASDGKILSILSGYLPGDFIVNAARMTGECIGKYFSGKYEGYLGADMFICRSGDGYRLAPCVEINVRMTMGLLARKFFDNCLTPEDDGIYRLGTVFSNGRYDIVMTHSDGQDRQGRSIRQFVP